LSFGFGFEQSKAWAGCDGPWAIIRTWWIVFKVKMGYPVLLVPDTRASALKHGEYNTPAH
jgi:hypothetical protein